MRTAGEPGEAWGTALHRYLPGQSHSARIPRPVGNGIGGRAEMKRFKKRLSRRESKTAGIKIALRGELRRAGVRCTILAVRDQYVMTHSRDVCGRHTVGAYCMKHERPHKLAAIRHWDRRQAITKLEEMMGGKGCTRCAIEAIPATFLQPKPQRERGYARSGV